MHRGKNFVYLEPTSGLILTPPLIIVSNFVNTLSCVAGYPFVFPLANEILPSNLELYKPKGSLGSQLLRTNEVL